jgi:site-specific recombinase XerD
MNHKSIDELFKQFKKRTGIHAYPHLLRHTHATELIKGGIDIHIVSKRLGHKSISTTINTYTHLTAQDLQIVIN